MLPPQLLLLSALFLLCEAEEPKPLQVKAGDRVTLDSPVSSQCEPRHVESPLTSGSEARHHWTEGICCVLFLCVCLGLTFKAHYEKKKKKKKKTKLPLDCA